jgi:alkylated DNA nucleotide flippase Atl1
VAVIGLLTPGPDGWPPEFAVDVLELVDQIPVGRVLSYGDIAEMVGRGGPRSVGRVMSLYGSDVPWWRVLHADGSVVPQKAGRAFERFRAEGTPLRGERVDMRRARWDGE